jgi:hypothetical protein
MCSDFHFLRPSLLARRAFVAYRIENRSHQGHGKPTITLLASQSMTEPSDLPVSAL